MGQCGRDQPLALCCAVPRRGPTPLSQVHMDQVYGRIRGSSITAEWGPCFSVTVSSVHGTDVLLLDPRTEREREIEKTDGDVDDVMNAGGHGAPWCSSGFLLPVA